MKRHQTHDRRCTYVVAIDATTAPEGGLRSFADYLSTLGVAGCDVLVIDASPAFEFEEHRRILRWVSRHTAARVQHRIADGAIDLLRAAADLAACEKVIVAGEDARYTQGDVDQMCDLLELHEVIEPQVYLDPLPWWGGIEAGRMLVHRGIEPAPDHATTYGFRRSAVRSLRGLAQLDPSEDPVRRLGAVGAEVFPAPDVFIRRRPPQLQEWFRDRPRQATEDFVLPFKTAFFFALIPVALLMFAAGGLQMASGYAGTIAFTSLALALRGRTGASPFFPFRACLFAPVWVFERSVSVYWALFRKLRATVEAPDPNTVPHPASGQRAASGS